MHWKLMYPNEYISYGDLDGKEWTMTIQTFTQKELMGTDGKKKMSNVMTFNEFPKKFVVNKTNAKEIAKQLGSNMDGWIGKQITLFGTYCNAFGDPHTECIRIKPIKRQGTKMMNKYNK